MKWINEFGIALDLSTTDHPGGAMNKIQESPETRLSDWDGAILHPIKHHHLTTVKQKEPTLPSPALAIWANHIQRECLLEAGDDVEAGLAAAEYIVTTQQSIGDSNDIALGWITIGGMSDGNEKHKEGTPVFIGKGGMIEKGPKSLVGRKITNGRKSDAGRTKSHKQPKSPTSTVDGSNVGASTFLKQLPRVSEADKIKHDLKKNKEYVEPPQGVEELPWKGEEQNELAGRIRSGEYPSEEEEIDPHKLVFVQAGGVITSRMQGFIDQGPPSKALKDRGRIEGVAAIRGKNGQIYLLEGNHRAMWAMAYGEKLRVHVADEPDGLKSKPLSISAFFAHDIHNHKAQGVLNRALQSAKGLSVSARKDLATAIKSDSGDAIVNFVNKYRLQLARLLTTTQMAALLEGAVEVASKVPPLGTVPIDGLSVVEQDRILSDPTPSPFALSPPTDSLEEIHFPTIDNAVKSLTERNVLTRPQYDALDTAARAKAFTVAGVDAEATLTKIRDVLAANVEKGTDYETFKQEILDAVDSGTFLSDAHSETVFRTNVQSAFSDGQMEVLNHPLVRSGFPYSTYDAIHDDRVRENHLALETLGINGTNVYRTDDPVFQMFRPPWDYNDRCSWTPITVRQAAESGVPEAQEWLRTGVEPSPRSFVPMPPFTPPVGFQRALNSAPLSIRLSLQPMAAFGFDPTEARDESGKWSKGGAVKKSKIEKPKRNPTKIDVLISPHLYTREVYTKLVGKPDLHEYEIEQALKKGKTIPPNVLTDYLHLTKLESPQSVQTVAIPTRKEIGGISATTRKTKVNTSDTAEKFINSMHISIDSQSRLTPEHKQAYKEAVIKVIEKMPDVAIARMAKHHKGNVWYENKEAMTDEIAKTNENIAEFKAGGGVINGMYRGSEQTFHLDGQAEHEGNEDIHQTYAHEFTHAIDGPSFEYAGSTEWQDAFAEELSGANGKLLSVYGTTSRPEGFAEFGRLLYGNDLDLTQVEKQFPKCSAFWKDKGLWPQ